MCKPETEAAVVFVVRGVEKMRRIYIETYKYRKEKLHQSYGILKL